MNILSIQSHVAYGYVGNRAAVFPLQRLGHEVTAINTVQFSNHTGYGEWEGEVFSPQHIQKILAGIDKRFPLKNFAAMLTGYLGDVALGEIILATVKQAKADNPELIYCCDPVMGDVGRGFFVRPGIPEFFRDQALNYADILTPNQFELEYLAATTITKLSDIIAACQTLLSQHAKIILVTSVNCEGINPDEIGLLATDGQHTWLVCTPKLVFATLPNGAGDATAAIFLAQYLKTRNIKTSLEFTASAIYAIFLATYQAGERELQLISTQDEIVNPSEQFSAQLII